MPAYCMGIGESHTGPIENSDWLKIEKTIIPGAPELAMRLAKSVMHSVDVAYSEEWQCDHGIMVPLNFLTPNYDLPVIPCNINCQGPPLTPLARVWQFGEALRQACDEQPEKIALVGTGGISHWPATPDSGKINEAWDRNFLDQLMNQDQTFLSSSQILQPRHRAIEFRWEFACKFRTLIIGSSFHIFFMVFFEKSPILTLLL